MKKVGKVEKSKLSQMKIYTILRWGGSRFSFSKIYLILLILRWDKIPMHQLDMIWVFFGKGHREFINIKIVHLSIFLKLGPRGTGISNFQPFRNKKLSTLLLNKNNMTSKRWDIAYQAFTTLRQYNSS